MFDSNGKCLGLNGKKKSLKIVEHIEKEKMLNNSQFNIEQCS